MSEHELWNELGNLYFMSGAYEPASYAYIRSINLDPGFGRPYSNLALVYVEKGKYTEAIELFRKSIDLLADTREKVTTMNRLGNAFRQIKDYNNAVAVYQKADELDPTISDMRDDIVQDIRAPLTLSMPAFDLKINQPAQKLSEEDQVFTPDPDSDRASIQTEDAICELAADILYPIPDTSDIPELDEMEIDETPALDISDCSIPTPDPVKIHGSDWHLDDTETRMEEEQGGFNFCATETVELDNQTLTETESVQYTQADYPLIELSDSELTAIENDIAKFTKVVNINPRNSMAWYTLGNLYKSIGQYKNAIFSYQQAIVADSTKAPYYYHLGLVLAAEKMYDDAINSFLKVIEIDPNYSLAHATLGGHYRKMGMDDLAQYHIRKAMGKAFMDENEYNRACLEAICGNTDNAISLLQVALSNKQTYMEWARRDPDLDFLRGDPRFQALVGQSFHVTK